MTLTRRITLSTFVLASAGLVLLATGGNVGLLVLGAVLAVGSALVLTRHLWRESNIKRDLAIASAGAKTTSDLTGALDTAYSRTVRNNAGAVEESTQTLREANIAERTDTRDVLASTSGADQQDLAAELRDAMLGLQESVETEVLTQLSGVVGVYSTLKPKVPFAPFGRSAVAGDCASRLVSLILSRRPRCVVEAGSGLSTVLIARALELLGENGRILAFEHKVEWANATKQMLAEHGLQEWASVVHTPLVPTRIGDEVFQWYDTAAVALPGSIDLIFIDGPPGNSGSFARYPAGPLLFDRLSVGGVAILDDASRSEEQSVLGRWKSEFPDLNFRFHKDMKGTEEITRT